MASSHYLTGICLPLLLFSATAGLIFVPLTMILVAGVSDEHAGIASSMFNAGQQVGGAVGLAVIGSVAWTIVNNHVRHSLAHEPAGHAAKTCPRAPGRFRHRAAAAAGRGRNQRPRPASHAIARPANGITVPPGLCAARLMS